MIETTSWPAGSYRSSFGSGNENTNRVEIVKGKVFTPNKTYHMTHFRSTTDLPSIPPPPQPSATNTRVSKPSKKSSSSSSKSSWSFNDPEMKRRTRVAKYKSYAVEGKVKASFKKGYRWIKRNCSKIVHSF